MVKVILLQRVVVESSIHSKVGKYFWACENIYI